MSSALGRSGGGEAIGLVVSDVDGTLVDKQKKLAPSTIDAVARLRAAGIGFTIISARPRSGMMPIADTLGIDDAMGAFNGGTVFKRDGTVICQRRIDPDVVRAMFDLVGDAPVDRWLFADDLWYASTDLGAHVGSERIASNQAPIVTHDFSSLYDRADKVTFISDDHALLDDLQLRAATLGSRATIMKSQNYYLDVTALAANKGDGVAALAKALDMPLAAVAVIGDQANDVPMFARAGLSIAMGQGPEEVRALADHVTSANDADGVARAIDEMILPQAVESI
ncbi:HAD family phosphatase [Sphingomonas sp. So64.6b]|uniref:Cof-type HAD-IIB family hydrolase n=1 Tax=Sphingomonas sp. So64.6b TaxID=2997354 RepID=UPI0015FF89A6|nr:Cof-type HAD-IIB family hydrolase [Sphingomonas sp. So64.6b]QNA85097.1 HAD family phosphatase [Sphingomonas sp. So64.6b]